MCGISGVFSKNNLDSDFVVESIESISHRGPDERGFFKNNYCSLGMCRLSIIDVKNGKQPNFNLKREIVSVFNGEIYNYRELRQMLSSRGYNASALGDSALIPYLYEEFGLDFVESIQGMYAIAILDIRFNELILIRDRLGKKPLWYSHEGNRISFSSELKGLLALGVKRVVDLDNIPEFLRFGYINAPRSPYQNIKQLEPGSFLRFSVDGIDVKKYWETNSVKPIEISFEEAEEEVMRLLSHAVRIRMISERPTGTFLSGGIDSTIVSALMAKESDESIHTFSIGFKDSKFDESIYAREVARAIGTNHHEKIVEPDPIFIVEKLINTLDTPFADSSIIPTFLLAQFAREEVVVSLSGDGGDEAFGGYRRYIASHYLNKLNPVLYLNPIPRIMFAPVKNEGLRKLLRHSKPKNPFTRYRDMQSLFQDRDFMSLLNLEIFTNSGDADFFDLWSSRTTDDSIRKMQEVDIHSYLPGDLLYKVDIASMANGLEVRSPFLDYRLIEFGLSLPQKFKFAKGQNKYLLREIAQKLVPQNLINRPKMGFGIPRSKWLRNELHVVVSDVLLSNTFRERGWFNYSEVRRVIVEHNKGKNFDNVIWPILMLELWARRWLDSH